MQPKYLFLDDYSEGAHPEILQILSETNLTQEMGYGQDSLCIEAANLIKKCLQDESVDVHFITGGTQANRVGLSALLKSYESVIATPAAHINIHETGAIESTGHKINLVESVDGKITVDGIRQVVAQHTDEHMVKPRAVFVSQATELGTLYSKKELESISRLCKELGLYIYLDGARLGSALTSPQADITFSDIPKLVDMFYIGGTKNGALLGEAMVIVNPAIKENFRFYLKQHGALLAKGRVLGAQYVALFKGDLYLRLAKHANTLAQALSEGMTSMGYEFLTPSATNQIFPILPNAIIENLEKKYGFYVWAKVNEKHSAIRLVTSWATQKEVVDSFLNDLKTS